MWVKRAIRWPHWPVAANVFFLVAAVLYVVSPVLCLLGEWKSCSVTGLLASVGFLCDSGLYLLVWYGTVNANQPLIFGETVRNEYFYQRFDYTLWGSGAFFVGCLVDLVTGFFSSWTRGGNGDGGHYSMPLYLAGSILWQTYSVLEIMRCRLDQENRRILSAKWQFSLLPWMASGGMAWDFWSAVLFFVAELFYLFDAFLSLTGLSISDDQGYIMQIVGAVLFVLSAVALFLDHAKRVSIGSEWNSVARADSKTEDAVTLDTEAMIAPGSL